MDVLNDDFIRFWKQLNANEVQYIMIGGFAIRFHGFNRSTDDLDMWLNDTVENRVRLRKTFKELEYGDFPMIETMEFIPGWTSFLITDGIELDIITEMKGLENLTFQECLKMASVANLEGTEVPFLHINHLIRNKKKTNRPKDQIDVIELERIKRLRNEENT